MKDRARKGWGLFWEIIAEVRGKCLGNAEQLMAESKELPEKYWGGTEEVLERCWGNAGEILKQC